MSVAASRFELVLRGAVDAAGRRTLVQALLSVCNPAGIAPADGFGPHQGPPFPLDYTESIWRFPNIPAHNLQASGEVRIRMVRESAAVSSVDGEEWDVSNSKPASEARVEVRLYAEAREVAAQHPGLDVRTVSGLPLVSTAPSGTTAASSLFPGAGTGRDAASESAVAKEAESLVEGLGRQRVGSFRVIGHEFLHFVPIGAPTGPDEVLDTDVALLAVAISQTCDPESAQPLSPGYWEVELLACAPINGETIGRVANAVTDFAGELSPFVVLEKIR